MTHYTMTELLAADLEPPKPLVEGLLNCGEVGMFVAPQKQGKSLFSLQLAMSKASGTMFANTWPVPEAGSVLYIAMEGTVFEWQRRTRRLQALLGIASCDNLHFEFQPTMYVNTPKGQELLVDLIEKYRPTLIIPDPLYHTHEGEMFTAHAMQKTTVFLDRVRTTTGAAIWLPHHTAKPTTNAFGFRNQARGGDSLGYGSAALGWWVDVEYNIQAFRQKKTSIFKCPYSRIDERVPEPEGEGIELNYVATVETQGFTAGLGAQLASLDLNGRTVNDLAEQLGQTKYAVTQALQGLQAQGKLVIMGGGRGRGNVATIAVIQEDEHD